MKRLASLLAALALLGATGCGGDDEEPASAKTPGPSATPTDDGGKGGGTLGY